MNDDARGALRVLVLAPFAPRLDGTHGGSRAIAQTIAALATRHRVAVLHLRGPGEPAMDDALRAVCDHVEEVARAPDRRRWRRAATRAAALARGVPLWVSRWWVPEFAARAAALAHRWSPDVVQFEFHIMGQFAAALDGCPARRVLVHHEPGAATAAARLRGARGAGWALAWLDAGAWRRYERSVMGRVHAVVAFTDRDCEALAPLAGDTPVVRIPLAAAAREQPLNPLGDPPPSLLFVGNYVHPPNVDAATRLATAILPRVRARRPDARLWIVGDGPPPALCDLAGEGVEVTGRVPDVTPYLDRAAVVVAPLREGGGMRVKVLDALAAGKAVVATPLAAAGVALTPGEHAVLAETDEEIAEAIVDLLAHPERRAALGAAAFAWARAHLRGDALATRFDALYARLGCAVAAPLAGAAAPTARDHARSPEHAARGGGR